MKQSYFCLVLALTSLAYDIYNYNHSCIFSTNDPQMYMSIGIPYATILLKSINLMHRLNSKHHDLSSHAW